MNNCIPYLNDTSQALYHNSSHNVPMMYPPGEMMYNMDIKTEPEAGSPVKTPKKRGPKKRNNVTQEKITDHMPVKKRKRDRFNGMSEDEVMKRELPDHLEKDLDIVIVGINPGLCAAYVGHHYAGPGNHFWKCMYLSGLIPEPFNAYDDQKLLKYGIGFTNIVARTTRGSADLTRKEIKEGAKLLTDKLQEYKPKIVVFNGKGIYEVFLGHKNFAIGKQPDPLSGTESVVYVMPSSSARCSQLPRAVDKVPFYAALKKLRDYLKGDIDKLDDSEVCFPDLELKVVKKEPKVEPDVNDNEFSASSSKCFSDMNNMNQSNPMYQMPPTHPNNYMSVKQEVPYNPQEYGNVSTSQQASCTFSNGGAVTQAPMYPPYNQMPPGENNTPFFPGGDNYQSPMGNQASFSQQMVSQQPQTMREQGQEYQGQGQGQSFQQGQGDFYQEQFRNSFYNQGNSCFLQQNFTRAPGFKQAMSMMTYTQQGQGQPFQMSQGQFMMSMSQSWPNQGSNQQQGGNERQQMIQMKQEPVDWSSGATGSHDQYYNNMQMNSSTGQGTSPLQHLQNLSQGIHGGSENVIQQSHTDPNYGMVHQNLGHSSKSSPHKSPSHQLNSPLQHHGSPLQHHGSPLQHHGSPQNSQSPLQHHNSPLASHEGSQGQFSQPNLMLVKKEPTDYTTDTTCPFQNPA